MQSRRMTVRRFGQLGRKTPYVEKRGLSRKLADGWLLALGVTIQYEWTMFSLGTL
jgi:hypothetical protein